ncbi:MAG: TetR/AcrR family transcriptional regulator [Bacteroidales bacterium]|nr:TetR/AcrR family transcriptional regulator [Bacteroidales bacterium]
MEIIMSDLTEKILNKASSLMSLYGISSVTMDDIAKECHISKRTLYEQIPDKRTLVWKCVLFLKEQTAIEAKTLIYESSDTLDSLLHIYQHMRKHISDISSVFFKDIHRLYPDIEKQYNEMYLLQSKAFANFLIKGVNEGVFRNDINFSLASKAFLAQSSFIVKEFATKSDPQETLRMIDIAFIIFLRGIATQKGLETIDIFLNDNII